MWNNRNTKDHSSDDEMANKRTAQTLNVEVIRRNGQDRQTLGQIPREDKCVTNK